MPKQFSLTFTLLLTVLSGCAQWGGQVLEDNHVAYNTSVAQAMDRQMLINIVRMSKDKPTQWMTVSNITVNTSVGANVGSSGSAYVPASPTLYPGSISGTGGLTYSYTPIITFVPLSGEQLAREMMSPINTSNIESLVSANWPISWITFLLCEQMQGLRSYSITRGASNFYHDKNFGLLLQTFDELQSKGLINIDQLPMPVTWNEEPIPAAEITLARVVEAKRDRCLLRIRPDGQYNYTSFEPVPVLQCAKDLQNTSDGARLLSLLDLGTAGGTFTLIAVDQDRTTDPIMGKRIFVRSRSLSSVLRMLSYGVSSSSSADQVPLNTFNPTELWKWMQSDASTTQNITDKIPCFFRVQQSSSAPKDAGISVELDGTWYFIPTADQSSSRVFAIVRELYDLQIKNDTSQSTPILTIPIG